MGCRGSEPADEVTDKPTFFVRILYRQHSSWQGEIQWMEGKKTRRFRSGLEMISLMQEALEGSERQEVDAGLRTWAAEEEGTASAGSGKSGKSISCNG